MPLDKDLTWRKLDALWENKDITVLDTKDKKYAIFSDTHFGNGGEADDFYVNKEALINALSFYDRHDFALILLGDIEEFWQFDLEDIFRCYANTIYSKIQAFGDARLYRIFGNHDREWGGWIDPIKLQGKKMGFADEAIKLRDTSGEVHLLLVHGHQGSIDADKYSWFSRFFVRIYSGIEFLMKNIGVFGQISATKSQVAKDYERTLYSWAKSRKVMLLCGHSHRAIFASVSHSERLSQKIANFEADNSMAGIYKTTRIKNLAEIENLKGQLEDEKNKGRVIDPVEPGKSPLPCYFNSGCGLYSDGMTALEIEGDAIRLVKWSKYSLSGNPREVFKEGMISEFVERIRGKA